MREVCCLRASHAMEANRPSPSATCKMYLLRYLRLTFTARSSAVVSLHVGLVVCAFSGPGEEAAMRPKKAQGTQLAFA